MSLIKECDGEDQLKYVYHHSNKIPIILKITVVLITALLFISIPQSLTKLYCSLLVIGFIVVFNSIKINHEKFISVNKHLGIEVQESSGIFRNNINHRFIPSNRILDIVISEGAKGLQFIFYLAIIVEDLDKLVLVFPNTDLKLQQLIQIRSDVRDKLFSSNQSKNIKNTSNFKPETLNEKEERIKNTKICKYLCEE